MADTNGVIANGIAKENGGPATSTAANTFDAQAFVAKNLAYITENPWVAPFYTRYETVKSGNAWLSALEEHLGAGTVLLLQKGHPLYQQHLEAHALHLSELCHAGVERTSQVLSTGKETAVRGGTVTLGAMIVATQLGLALSAGGATLLLDATAATQKAAGTILRTTRDVEQAVERRVWKALGDAYSIARIPVDKSADAANAFLDVASAIVERALGVNVPEDSEATLATRVKRLSSIVAGALSNKAHDDLIDPAQSQLRGLLEHISKSFILMDIVRQKKEWALEKMDELSASVNDLKIRIETESQAYRKSPEEILLTGIQSTSRLLTDKLTALEEKNVQVFGDGNKMNVAINYFQNLETSFGDAGDLYQVRDEVLSEARQKLADLISWTGNLLARSPANSASANQTR